MSDAEEGNMTLTLICPFIGCPSTCEIPRQKRDPEKAQFLAVPCPRHYHPDHLLYTSYHDADGKPIES